MVYRILVFIYLKHFLKLSFFIIEIMFFLLCEYSKLNLFILFDSHLPNVVFSPSTGLTNITFVTIKIGNLLNSIDFKKKRVSFLKLVSKSFRLIWLYVLAIFKVF